jgi:hypothetical protein
LRDWLNGSVFIPSRRPLLKLEPSSVVTVLLGWFSGRKMSWIIITNPVKMKLRRLFQVTSADVLGMSKLLKPFFWPPRRCRRIEC